MLQIMVVKGIKRYMVLIDLVCVFVFFKFILNLFFMFQVSGLYCFDFCK